MKTSLCMLMCMLFIYSLPAIAQQKITTGKIFDAITKEPLTGATIRDEAGHLALSDASGYFSIQGMGAITVSYNGYATKKMPTGETVTVGLQPVQQVLQDVMVSSAGRITQKRSEAPVAIATISAQTITDTKAQRLDQLLNKVSGVFMVNLGNEQHEMSIRQPMTTKSVFLYLEDGIPVRTTGVYNHNALLEMNLTAAKNIEVIKGPASALYGAEAIAGAVNIITQASPAVSCGSLSIQLNNNGYRRTDMQVGTPLSNTFGVIVSGYHAERTNGQIEYSDFHKNAISLRTDYKPGNNTSWVNSFSLVDYYSDMTGTLDSQKFAQHNYSTPYSFTYRAVKAFRLRSSLQHRWNTESESSVSIVYRDNSVKQNPSYSIGTTGNPLLYRGQINENAFSSVAVFVQHSQLLPRMHSRFVAGISLDRSPQSYYAHFIWINKDPTSGKLNSYYFASPDSLLQHYNTNIINPAGYLNYEWELLKNLKLVAAIRYDGFIYDFSNHLDTAKTSVAISSLNRYHRFTPKAGFTYNHGGIGFYANYSEGYVPPQLTELYSSGAKVAPLLSPQTFYNYELGGWLSLLQNKLYADWSFYLMNGTNEIISVRQPDNTYLNQNAGKTRHTGIEYGVTYKPNPSLTARLSATNAHHQFIENIVRGVNYNGKEMSSAPRFTGNAEISWKPQKFPGFKMSIEWQHQGKYFMDDLDNYSYPGFDMINLRTGYTGKHFECWINLLNSLNAYYATLATKNASVAGNSSYAYQLGDPREITLGIGYRFGK